MAQPDPNALGNEASVSAAKGGAVVVPSDSTNLSQVSRSLYIGTAGNVSVVMLEGQTLVFQNVPAGTVLPVRVSRVNATGTTAAAGSILVLW